MNRRFARDTQHLQPREPLMGAANAESKAIRHRRDVGADVAAAGVADGTFFFHFPAEEHVLLDLERREEERIATQLARFADTNTTSRRHRAKRSGSSSDWSIVSAQALRGIGVK